jgi:CBS domain-containing protein
MQVEELMTRSVEVVAADASVVTAAKKMRAFVIGALPVTSEGRLVGIVTDRDLAERALTADGDPRLLCVRDVMTTTVVTCHPDDLIDEVVERMLERSVRRVIVVDKRGSVVGILSVDDLALAPSSRWTIAVLRRTTGQRGMELDGILAES